MYRESLSIPNVHFKISKIQPTPRYHKITANTAPAKANPGGINLLPTPALTVAPVPLAVLLADVVIVVVALLVIVVGKVELVEVVKSELVEVVKSELELEPEPP